MPTATPRTGLPAGFGGADLPERLPRTGAMPRPDVLERGVDTLLGVGPAVQRKLARLGIVTVGDLLAHRPRRYETAADERTVAGLIGDDEAVLEVVVRRASGRRRGRLHILTAHVADETGEIRATWFNQPWLEKELTPGTRLRLRGKRNRFGFQVSSYDLGDATQTADFAPVYPATADLAQKTLRTLTEQVLGLARDGGEPLPARTRSQAELPLRADALVALHRPRSEDQAERARRRLALDELVSLQVALRRRAAERESLVAEPLPPPGPVLTRYREELPFTLTDAQERAIDGIDADLGRSIPMQRLLQGDVGSGKTAVALYTLLRAVEVGRQGALMAPTETLAEQHFLTIETLCAELGVRVALLTSSLTARERRAAHQLVASGDVGIAVGTHALIQREVAFSDLAVAVVDEQHRFGVEQRAALAEGRSPHVLHMTATPIPRTLALTVYGDLAVSEIAAPPADRKPIVTAWVTEERSSEAYSRLRRHLDAGRQAYVVCPLVEGSETRLARAAEDEAERLRAHELRGYRVGCVHGRLKTAERRAVMAAFTAGELDVLVATTVIEVGVDVPNATIMIVQEADRFGLAQLHQLRGRVGRGAEQSFCLLVSGSRDELSESALERLEAMVATTDGFELAERDLEIRGEGQLVGARQSGLTDLRFTRLRADRDLLEQAKSLADELGDDPLLADSAERLLGEAEHVGDS
ncbi:ATP-dependent DNA helicase RecG [Gaiella sp.]|uniref:ATP-dependent DNA helicase RecG n=1 Tax=Gaiella sp. TaxID=2663207 RepID=UPI002E2EEBB1|nr:ATP-dependent DNA helicase RecG [Gaiella sp.]HEX5582057.1 ATP-dependent DNA helicase RecG [Gaiella sp.]